MKGTYLIMKKIIAILLSVLLVLTFASCVKDDQGDVNGDVSLPEESSSGNNVEPPTESDTSANTGTVQDGIIDLPIDWFD